jgi:hypothetical protein
MVMVKSQRQKDREEWEELRKIKEVMKQAKVEVVRNMNVENEKEMEGKQMEEIKLNDSVNHPSHYEGHTSIDCIDTMILTFGVKRTAEYCVQTAYKYIWRHENKNGIQDLKKAEWYLNKFDELVTWCETKFSADGTIEMNYLEIGQVLRGMIKTERKKYEVNK